MMVHIKVILFDNFEVQLGKIIITIKISTIIIELGLFRKSYSLTLKIIIYHYSTVIILLLISAGLSQGLICQL